ncbi:DUF1513 domain-containing protein [Vibrio mediterranei]|uniref:DUF1513 domain-containing protein n=1 Tax=Vibrio mediterranei TaxID=689 RepID=UPI0017ACD4F8|nr:DUF1513 domain-containing protein [Vibrio mediterranei]NUW72934.1 DUF1513 domain-containing protein [Vibrio mediterranei]
MRLMAIDISRRNFTKLAGITVMSPSLLTACASTTKMAQETLIGGSVRNKGDYEVIVSTENATAMHRLPLPDRGHGIAVSPNTHHAVMFARRPGSYAMVFDYREGEVRKLILAPNNRHFYGHGVYSNDGRWLYATEGERSSSRGIIGVYDVANGYKKIEEFTGFGLGPHEVIVMADDSLVVGVGGVHTNGRQPKNLATMQPSLSYLSPQGELLEQATLGDHHKSIRHLAHDGDTTVLTGQQYRGEAEEYVPLVAIHQRGSVMEELGGEPEQWARFNHYIASIAATETHILATSPRGSCYGIWDKTTRELLEINSLPDASGVVVRNGDFHVSSGAGQVIKINPQLDKQRFYSGIQWDNHWSAIT